MANKGILSNPICEIPLFDPILPKMDCPLFEVTTVCDIPHYSKTLFSSLECSIIIKEISSFVTVQILQDRDLRF